MNNITDYQMKMKIAQLAQPILPTPPLFYGGTERIVSMLTESLVKRGHKVTLYATGDSKTKARLKYQYKKAVGIDDFRPIHSLVQTSSAFNDSGDYDIIHNHAEAYCLPMAKYVKTPVVTTLHNDYIVGNTPQFSLFRNSSHFVFISKSQKKRLRGLRSAGVVYNATDMDKYKICENKKDYMFFIGNLLKRKGPDLAVRAVKSLNEKMIMALKIDEKDQDFFKACIKPFIDGKNIKMVQTIPFKKKLELYQHARCLLFPIRWEEPFGLVMVEAMACGTPVVAMNHGSVSEIVKHGETGFVANNYKEFVSYAKRIDEIDPKKCRKHVEKLFSIEAMTDGYERIYRKLKK